MAVLKVLPVNIYTGAVRPARAMPNTRVFGRRGSDVIHGNSGAQGLNLSMAEAHPSGDTLSDSDYQSLVDGGDNASDESSSDSGDAVWFPAESSTREDSNAAWPPKDPPPSFDGSSNFEFGADWFRSLFFPALNPPMPSTSGQPGHKWEIVHIPKPEASSPSAASSRSESARPPLLLPQSFLFPSIVGGRWAHSTERTTQHDLPTTSGDDGTGLQLRGSIDTRRRDGARDNEATSGGHLGTSKLHAPHTSAKPRATTRLPPIDSTTRPAEQMYEVSSQPPPKPANVKVDYEEVPDDSMMSEIWPLYVQRTRAEDKETVKAWNTDLDSILIFAALFSSALTTFIIESYRNLQPDPTSELLQAILFELKAMRDPAIAGSTPVQQFKVDPSAVRVNVYWFSSLILSLSAALIAILAKQWVNYLLAGLSPVPSARARHRQYRMDGMRRWNLPAILSFLPVLLHISLLLFFTGLVDFIWGMNQTVAIISAVLVCITAITYAIANLLAYLYPDCPFKTSVTVLFALVIDYMIIAFVTARLTTTNMGRSLLVRCHHTLRTWRTWIRHRDGASIGDGGPPLRRTGTIVASERRHYESLRITSLRRQDEKFIEANKTFVDSRILLWLMRNADRFHDAEKLSRAIVHFPHLVLHRRLFIHKGVFAYLERLLRNWMKNGKFSSLPAEKRREAITSAMHALSVLESEVGVDGPEYKAALDPEDVVSELRTPFLMIQPTPNPTASPLSPSTFPVIISLLSESKDLPFPLLASTLRLSVRIPVVRSSSSVSYKPLVERFLAYVAQLEPPSEDFCHITHAVNTIIYLALHDTSYPNRDGFAIPYIGDARHWLNYMSKLMPRPSIPSHARLQMSWAVCVLERSLNTTIPDLRLTAIVKPRIPRFREAGPLAGHLTSLVTSGPSTDPDVICAALAALEGILWSVTPERKDVNRIADLLRPARGASTNRFYQLLTRERIRKSGPQGVRIAISMTRIAVYLSIFHTPRPAALAESDVLHHVFGSLRYLATVTGLPSPPQDAAEDPLPAGQSPSQVEDSAVAKAVSNDVRLWTCRASGRIITLLFRADQGRSLPHIDPLELAFADESSVENVAIVLVTALQDIAEDTGTGPYGGWRIHGYIRESFFGILDEVFTRAAPNSTRELRSDSSAWNWQEAADIVVCFVNQKGMSVMLGGSSLCDTEAGMAMCRGALHAVCAMLSTESGLHQPFRADPAATTGNGTHFGAGGLATVLRERYSSMREMLPAWTEAHFTNPMAEDVLIDFIRISGKLAFCTPQKDTIGYDVLGGLLVFLSTLLLTKRPPGHLVTARRHGWGTLGTIVTLCALSGEELRAQCDIERHFRFNTDTRDGEDRIAAGLIRLLMLTNIENIPDPDSHCGRCQLHPHEHIRLLLQLSGHTRVAAMKLFKRAVIVALDVIATLWSSEDTESLAVRECLCRHGLASRLAVISLLEGRSGDVAGKIMAKMTKNEKSAYTYRDRKTIG